MALAAERWMNILHESIRREDYNEELKNYAEEFKKEIILNCADNFRDDQRNDEQNNIYTSLLFQSQIPPDALQFLSKDNVDKSLIKGCLSS